MTFPVPGGSTFLRARNNLTDLADPSVAWQTLAGGHSAHAQRWQAGLGGRHYASAVVAVVGDSFTSGNLAGLTWAQTWPVMLQDAMNTRYPSNGLATHGRGMLAPVLIGEVTPGYVTVTGTPGEVQGYGYNNNAYDISAGAGCTLTYDLVGDFFIIVWRGTPGGGSFTYKINSGSPVTVSTAWGSVADGQTTFVGTGFTPGTAYTLTIEYASGTPVLVDAVLEFNGDLGAGIQVYNSGASGTETSDWTGQSWAPLAASTPQLVIIELGGDDWESGVTPAAFQANLTTIISDIAAACAVTAPPPDFLLVTAVGQTPAEPYPWQDFVNVMYAVAAASDSNVDVLDLTLRMPANLGDDPSASLYDPSTGELTTTGHSLVADIVLAYLGPQ